MDGIWVEMFQIGSGFVIAVFGYAVMMAIGEGEDDERL